MYLSGNVNDSLYSCLFWMFLFLCSINTIVGSFKLVLQAVERIDGKRQNMLDIEKSGKKNFGLLLFSNLFKLFLCFNRVLQGNQLKKWGM